jgi:hypothetical protein
MINFMSEKTLKQIMGTIVCCAGLAFGVVNAEETAPAADTPAEDPGLWDKTKETSGEAWDATKEGSAKAWDATKETSGEAWDATKEGSAKAWDATKETSGEAWNATKEGSARAWDATKETSGEAWDATKEVFTDSDTPEEAPAAGNPQQ